MLLPKPIIKAIGVERSKANQSVRNNKLAKEEHVCDSFVETMKQLQSGEIDKHTITTPRAPLQSSWVGLLETTNDHQPI
jgi:hypothetical protein